ncbi:response regulator [Marinibaculum pumilum]|uniref:Response regulator n=1 Tax=Marinibaculum pumilum TaxID=1766165 RepID=A0ABV7L9I1_9PROT
MSGKATILVVEDDAEVSAIVRDMLSDEGYAVECMDRAAPLMPRLEQGGVDLLILDLMLPDADGLDITMALRDRKGMGLVILSGKSETDERIIGLELGADDYVPKPFEPRELLARVRSVMRRLGRAAQGDTEAALLFDGLRLDPTARSVAGRDGAPIALSNSEYSLLLAFVRNPNQVLSREKLLELTHQAYMPAFDRSIDVRVGRLRKKIERDAHEPGLIQTVRHIGYIFATRVEEEGEI